MRSSVTRNCFTFPAANILEGPRLRAVSLFLENCEKNTKVRDCGSGGARTLTCFAFLTAPRIFEEKGGGGGGGGGALK